MKKLDKKMSMFIIVIFFFGDLTLGQDFFFGNNKPVADAGNDIKILSGGSISLDGSRSFVGDGSKIKYQWIFAPGLARKSDNDFSSEISMETYGSTYLKSVKTHNKVLSVKLSDNEPGTKLEVVLKVKDRIGFEDMDTLIVEYLKPKVPVDTSVKTLTSTMQSPLELPGDALGCTDSQ